ncbi:SAM-dependent methyltransferase [Rhexocercosporidium sp. MPI-PUGE-AT-0058]|nr:SAM-dependent methyltransferase [Rhexocercosporidium sp. MPI-PUGE-AT-0058]
MDYDWIIDGGYIPQTIAKMVVRQVVRMRHAEPSGKSLTEATNEKMKYVAKLKTLPIAIETKAANTQQYEVGTGIFAAFLGPRMKYSCSLFSTGSETLAEAESAMLQQYLPRAEIKDGMTILDLGCGWGSATLFFAEQLPASRVVGFSNSKTQKEYIEEEGRRRNIKKIEIITGDVAEYEFEAEQFDRVVSVELFEHMKNYGLLMAKVARALKPGGKLFVHIFCHRSKPYDFDEGWMSRYFFTGGTMPSADLLLFFQQDLQLQKQWWVSGQNYMRTLQVCKLTVTEKLKLTPVSLTKAWLSNFTSNKEKVWPDLIETYGEKDATVWYNRWIFYHIGGSEFFGTGGGEVNGVSHYLFEKPQTPQLV